jgi:cytoskeletal protein RodZ
MKKNIKGKMVCLLVLFVAVVFLGADLPVAAQNTNSSSTGDSMMQGNSNANPSMGRRRRQRRQRRRARRRARRNTATTPVEMQTDANANTATDTPAAPDTNMNSNMSSGGQSGSMPGMGTFGDVADLSGTYTGTVNYAEGGMTGEATLTLTGNTFTITAGSATASGTLSARSWPGYTALSMRFGDTLPATIVSTRAWHKGRGLRIQSVRGETRPFTFNGRSQ